MNVKIREVVKRAGFFRLVQSGLAIAIVAHENDMPSDLVTPITRAVMKWKRKRGDKAYAVSFTFSTVTEMHQAVEAAFFQLYRHTAELQHIFDRTGSISVTLCDENGRPVRSYSVDPVGLLQGKYKRIETPIRADGQVDKHARRRGKKSSEETAAEAQA